MSPTTAKQQRSESPQVAATSAGWQLRCPVCWRQVLPLDGSLHYLLAPRLAYHLWDAHPAEAAILRLHLFRPPAQWPEAIEGDEALEQAFRMVAA